jgi:hypothetical protein
MSGNLMNIKEQYLVYLYNIENTLVDEHNADVDHGQ